MKPSWCLLGALLALSAIEPGRASERASLGASSAPATAPTEKVRMELLAARETAWRAFFGKDPAAVLEQILGPELIAIQQSDERWDDRNHLAAMATRMSAQNIRIVRLEFPRTEIQLFGETAILYYSYVFETAGNGASAVDAGRGTEVFVRRDGRWIDVGWHLDNGPFVRKDGAWVRKGDPVPDPQSPARPKP